MSRHIRNSVEGLLFDQILGLWMASTWRMGLGVL